MQDNLISSIIVFPNFIQDHSIDKKIYFRACADCAAKKSVLIGVRYWNIALFEERWTWNLNSKFLDLQLKILNFKSF